jgi:FkbM family methyltransferase
VPRSPIDRFNELVYLKTLLKIQDINCVLDVGANCGQFAYELRAIGYSGYIISFEPTQQAFAMLFQSFNNDSKWKGYQVALGSESKSMKINVSGFNGEMSSLLEFVDGQHNTESQGVEVKRLDDLFPSITEEIQNPRIFLKMDTQGYDLEVFRGVGKYISNIQGLQSEIAVQGLYKNMPHYIECLSEYEKAGFELYNLTVVSRISSGGLRELNAFMRRPANST